MVINTKLLMNKQKSVLFILRSEDKSNFHSFSRVLPGLMILLFYCSCEADFLQAACPDIQ